MNGNEKPAFEPLRVLTRLKRSVRKRILFRKFGDVWNMKRAFQSRTYNSYEAYLEHQRAKLETHDFANYDTKFRAALRERLAALKIAWQGRTVLCLAARIGTEVKAFLDLGCFAIGIDLNPGKENRFVVHGDFHKLQFATKSVDVVYTNSLDHAFDIDQIAKEVSRVLKRDGLLIVEAVQGRDQGVSPGFFESFFWKNIDELIRLFEVAGFEVKLRTPITDPWPGEAICFKQGGAGSKPPVLI